MSKSVDKSGLGRSDVVAGAVLFLLLSVLLKLLLDAAVPGLLHDETLLQVQISGLMFLLFWALMGNFLFKPYLDVVIEREDKTRGLLQIAGDHKKKSRLLHDRIEEELRQERLAAIEDRDRVTDIARRNAAQSVAKAAQAAEEKRHSAQEEVKRIKQQALLEVPKEAEDLAQLVFERTLASN